MRFARYVFIGAGLWGIAVLAPLFWLRDITGLEYAPPTSYPHFFYGFLAVAAAWQLAFLLIGSDPARYRPLMIPGILEKLGFVVTAAVLHAQRRISSGEASVAVPDAVLCALFVVAFAKTPRAR